MFPNGCVIFIGFREIKEKSSVIQNPERTIGVNAVQGVNSVCWTSTWESCNAGSDAPLRKTFCWWHVTDDVNFFADCFGFLKFFDQPSQDSIRIGFVEGAFTEISDIYLSTGELSWLPTTE
uniref:Uncharacterized protein n=1 Tax=Romanomermis culicivorax TaxID=13658 RepID=A0A915KG92_ROMCU